MSKADIPASDARSGERFRTEALAKLGDLLGRISLKKAPASA